jgi:DNA-binding transcriptional regulator YiaG
MSSLIGSLKFEIARVARKELKEELLGLRKATTAHRSEIAALKRQVKTLVSELKAYSRVSRATAKSLPADEESAAAPRIRFTGERFAAWRAKMGITQAQTAQVLEASALSVFKWESGKANPRNAQLQKIATVMKLGKRELIKKLEE